MSLQIKCLMILLALSFAAAIEYPQLIVGEPKDPSTSIDVVTHNILLAPYMNKDTKSLFKVWHFIYNKDYDFNTEAGIQKYRVFKANLNLMKEHNASKSSWKMGINHLSDMKDDEISAYYNLKPFDNQEIYKNLRPLNDEDDHPNWEDKKVFKSNVDHRPKMRPVRNQGKCGSCWAYATQAVMEGCFQLWHGPIGDHFSTQQSVDCDSGNNGCSGGWPPSAMNYFTKATFVYDSTYPYTGTKSNCNYRPGMRGDTKLKISGYVAYDKKKNDVSLFDNMLKKGPMEVGVEANSDWYRYSSGIFDIPCKSESNHAVTLVGYVVATGNDTGDCPDNKGGYFIVRNSWGSAWGDNGHIMIKDMGATVSSCNVDKLAWQPASFKN
jgi:hypothetical protein